MILNIKLKRAGGTPTLAAQELEDALRARGYRCSTVRTAILEAFAAWDGHASAEELTARVRERFPHLSPSTVYRTLNVLVSAGLATARAFGDGHTRFELASAEHHDHLVCTTCGRIVEFRDDEIERLQDAVAHQLGFEMKSHRLELYGTCEGCLRAATH